MTELEQKIITALGDRNLTMQEIADTVGIPASEMYQQGLLRLIGTGDVEKILSDKMTVYRLAPQARVTRLACTPQARLDSTNHNIISQEKERECTVGYKGGIRGKRKEIPPYPEEPEEVVAAAKEIGYFMSVREAAKFISIYAPYEWESIEGRKIRNWPKLLYVWQSRQKPDEYSRGKREAERREQGLPPVNREELEYEYYEDAQGRKWRKRPEDSDWEEIFEEITFSDGTKAIKGVV